MKQKIKIMKAKPELSDQEINSYMDFDGLLAKQKQHTTMPVRNIMRWGILIAVVGSLSLWWFTQEEVAEKPESIITNQQADATKSPVDQPAVENVTPQQQSNDKAVVDETKNKEQHSTTPPIQKEVAEGTAVPSVRESVYLQAEPVEGYAHLYQYFGNELVYPPAAIKDSVQGVLTVSFTVNAEGKPEGISVTNSLGELFDKEAIRLIQNMPAWKPAMLNNKPVPSKMALPLTFQIQKVKVQE